MKKLPLAWTMGKRPAISLELTAWCRPSSVPPEKRTIATTWGTRPTIRVDLIARATSEEPGADD